MNTYHVPVLLEEVFANLDLQKKDIVLDCTIGGGGHASYILKNSPLKKYIGIDRDIEAINWVKNTITDKRLVLHHTNFHNITKAGIDIKGVNKIIVDLGVSSRQIDSAQRGFSYMQEGPLDMRMDNSSEEITAGEILNNYKTEELANIFYNYGQEPKSRILAVEIAKYRLKKPFTSTTQFKDFIMEAIYGNYTRKMTAVKRVFQALRIYINDELKDLDRVLLNLVNILPEKGRMAVISFHSLEDRITKHTFKELISSPNQSSIIKLVNKKPIIPSLEELKLNSRAESSKLRVIETVSLRKA